MEDILYDKHYYESYALLSLKHFWDGYSDGFENADRPDLQNKNTNIGIEVVQALSEDEGMWRSKIIECNDTDDIDAINTLYNSKFDIKRHIEQILEKIDIKLKKLNKDEDGYTLFKTNALYIFAESDMIQPEDIRKIIQEVHKKFIHFELKFDILFVNAVDKLFVIKNSDISTIYFNKEVMKTIHREAIERSEAIRLLNGT